MMTYLDPVSLLKIYGFVFFTPLTFAVFVTRFISWWRS